MLKSNEARLFREFDWVRRCVLLAGLLSSRENWVNGPTRRSLSSDVK